jgi:hypothetical protein
VMSSRFALFSCLLCALSLCRSSVADEEWQVVKAEHFIVYYKSTQAFAEKVAHAAEEDYQRIMNDLGFAKRDDFWLWKNRVSIYVCRTRDEFMAATGAPKWAAGKSVYKKKEIVTFGDSSGFLGSVLPHEITHLVFRDFVGFEGDVPLWLNEGVAQWEESSKREASTRLTKGLLNQNRLMSLEQLTRLDIRKVDDSGKAVEFYAQAASLVGYLIREHGSERFRKLCGQLRDGKDLNDALRFTYSDTVPSMKELESAWRKYLGAAK